MSCFFTDVQAVSPPEGLFCGNLIGIIKENITVNSDSTFDYHNTVSVAKIHVDCMGEKFVMDANGTMDISKNLADPTDCLAKAAASDPKLHHRSLTTGK